MKIAEMILNAILKRGIFSALENVDLTIESPDTKVKTYVKIGSMNVTFVKDEEN